MTASSVLLLFLAVIAAITVRVAESTAAPTGGSNQPVWTRQNKLVAFGIAAAIVVAVFMIVVPISGLAMLIPFLCVVVVSTALVLIAIPWPVSRIGDWFNNLTWGVSYPVIDPATDPRLDPNAEEYDPRLDPNAEEYDRDYIPNSPRYGLLALLGAAAIAVVYLILAWILVGLSGLSFGSMGGNPSEPNPMIATQAPATADPTPTVSDPTMAPTSKAPASPKATKPAGESPKVSTATCDEVKSWLPAVPGNVQHEMKFYSRGVERCTGDGEWEMWTGETPSRIIVTHSYVVTINEGTKNERVYEYFVFPWKGEDVLIRVGREKKVG